MCIEVKDVSPAFPSAQMNACFVPGVNFNSESVAATFLVNFITTPPLLNSHDAPVTSFPLDGLDLDLMT